MSDITKSFQKALQIQKTASEKAKEQLSPFEDENVNDTLASIQATEEALMAKQRLDSLEAYKAANDSFFPSSKFQDPFLETDIKEAKAETLLAASRLQSIETQNELKRLEKLKEKSQDENIRQGLTQAYEISKIKELPSFGDFTKRPVQSDWIANWKEVLTRGAGGMIGGTGVLLESAGDTWESLFAATFGTEEGDTWGERFNNRYNWAVDNRTSTQDFFNRMARPFNEIRYRNNFQSMHMNLDGIKNEEGFFNTASAIGEAIFDVIPSMIEGAVAGVPKLGAPMIFALAIGEMNKERQAALLRKNPTEIMDVDKKYTDNIALMSAALYTFGGYLEGAMLKRLVTGKFFDSDVQKLQKAYQALDKKMYMRNGDRVTNTPWFNKVAQKASEVTDKANSRRWVPVKDAKGNIVKDANGNIKYQLREIAERNKLSADLKAAKAARAKKIEERQKADAIKRQKSNEFWDRVVHNSPIAGRAAKYAVKGGKFVAPVAGGLLGGMLMEGVSETIQTFAEQTNRYQGNRYNTDEILEAGIIGALAGGAFGTVSGVADKFRNPSDGRTLGEIISNIFKDNPNSDNPNEDTIRKEISKALGLREGTEIDRDLSQAINTITSVAIGETNISALYDLAENITTLANSDESVTSAINNVVSRVNESNPDLGLNTFGVDENGKNNNTSLQGTIKNIETRLKELTGKDEETQKKREQLQEAIKELEEIQVGLTESATRDAIKKGVENYNAWMQEFVSPNSNSENSIRGALSRLVNREYPKDDKGKAKEQREKDLSIVSTAARIMAIARKYPDGKIKLNNGETLELAPLRLSNGEMHLSEAINKIENGSKDGKGNNIPGVKSIVKSKIAEAKKNKKEKGESFSLRDIADIVNTELKGIKGSLNKTDNPSALLDAFLRYSYINSKEFKEYITNEISTTLNSQVENLIEGSSSNKDEYSVKTTADLRQDLTTAIDALKAIGVATNTVFESLGKVLEKLSKSFETTENKINAAKRNAEQDAPQKLSTTDKIAKDIVEQIKEVKDKINEAKELPVDPKSKNKAINLYVDLFKGYRELLNFLNSQEQKLSTITTLYNSIMGKGLDGNFYLNDEVKNTLKAIHKKYAGAEKKPSAVHFYLSPDGSLTYALKFKGRTKDNRTIITFVDPSGKTIKGIRFDSTNSIFIRTAINTGNGTFSLFPNKGDNLTNYYSAANGVMNKSYPTFVKNVSTETKVLLPAIIADTEVALKELAETHNIQLIPEGSNGDVVSAIEDTIENTELKTETKAKKITEIYDSITTGDSNGVKIVESKQPKDDTNSIKTDKVKAPEKSGESTGTDSAKTKKAKVTKVTRVTKYKKTEASKELFNVSTAMVNTDGLEIEFSVNGKSYTISNLGTETNESRLSDIISEILLELSEDDSSSVNIHKDSSNNSYFYMNESTFKALFESLFSTLLSANDRVGITSLTGLDEIKFFEKIKISDGKNPDGTLKVKEREYVEEVLLGVLKKDENGSLDKATRVEAIYDTKGSQAITNTDIKDGNADALNDVAVNLEETSDLPFAVKNNVDTSTNKIVVEDSAEKINETTTDYNKVTHTTNTEKDEDITYAIDDSIKNPTNGRSATLTFNIQDTNGNKTRSTYESLKKDSKDKPLLKKVLNSIIEYIRNVTIDLKSIIYIKPTDKRYNVNMFNSELSIQKLQEIFKSIFDKDLNNENIDITEKFDTLFRSYLKGKNVSNIFIPYNLLNNTIAVENPDGSISWQYGKGENAEVSPVPSVFVQINNAAALFLSRDKDRAKVSPYSQQARVLAVALLVRALSNPVFLSKNETNEQLLERFSVIGAEAGFQLKKTIAAKLQGSAIYNEIITDIGKQFMSVLNIELDPTKVRDGQVEQLQREIGAMILQVGIDAGLFKSTFISRSDISQVTSNKGAKIVLVSPTDKGKALIGLPVASKSKATSISKNDNAQQTKKSQDNVNKFLETLGIEKVDDKLNYTTDNNIVLGWLKTLENKVKNNSIFKLGKGKIIRLTKQLQEAISTISRTGYTLQNVDYLTNLLYSSDGTTLVRNESKILLVAKALGYIGYEKKGNGYYYKTQGDNSVIPAKDIESIETTNRQIMDDLEALMSFLEAGHKDPTIFSSVRITANGRLHYQGGEIDIQSRPIFRFLFAPRKSIIKSSLNEIKKNAESNYNMFYVAIATSFGYSYDKESHANSVSVGKAILKVFENARKKEGGLTNLYKDILFSMESGPGAKLLEVTINGDTNVALELEYTSHTLTTLFQLMKLVQDPNIEQNVYIPIEVDSTNSGGALKTLQNFVSPLSLKLLRSVGITFGTLSGKIKGEKVYDLYQQLGLALSDSEYSLTADNNINNTTNSILKAFKKLPSKDENGNNKAESTKLFKKGRIGDRVTNFLEKYIFEVNDGTVTKILRNAMKSIGHPINYSAGINSILNALNNFILDSLVKDVVKWHALHKNQSKGKAEKAKYDEFMASNPSILLLKSYIETDLLDGNNNKSQEVVGKKLENLLKEILTAEDLSQVYLKKVPDKGKESINHKASISLTNVTSDLFKTLMRDKVEHAIDMVYPGQREIGDNINAAVNDIFYMVNSLTLSLKESIIAKRKTDNNSPYLTEKESRELNRELAKLLPGIQLASVTSSDGTTGILPFGNGKSTHVDLNPRNKIQIHLNSEDGKSDSSITIRTSQDAYNDAGAGGNVIEIHQLDGSIMTFIINDKKVTKGGKFGMEALFIAIHDAVTTNFNHIVGHAETMNRGIYTVNSNYNLRQMNYDIALYAYELAELLHSTNLGLKSTANTEMSERFLARRMLGLAYHRVFVALGDHNSSVAYNADEIVVNNANIGIDVGTYTHKNEGEGKNAEAIQEGLRGLDRGYIDTLKKDIKKENPNITEEIALEKAIKKTGLFETVEDYELFNSIPSIINALSVGNYFDSNTTSMAQLDVDKAIVLCNKLAKALLGDRSLNTYSDNSIYKNRISNFKESGYYKNNVTTRGRKEPHYSGKNSEVISKSDAQSSIGSKIKKTPSDVTNIVFTHNNITTNKVTTKEKKNLYYPLASPDGKPTSGNILEAFSNPSIVVDEIVNMLSWSKNELYIAFAFDFNTKSKNKNGTDTESVSPFDKAITFEQRTALLAEILYLLESRIPSGKKLYVEIKGEDKKETSPILEAYILHMLEYKNAPKILPTTHDGGNPVTDTNGKITVTLDNSKLYHAYSSFINDGNNFLSVTASATAVGTNQETIKGGSEGNNKITRYNSKGDEVSPAGVEDIQAIHKTKANGEIITSEENGGSGGKENAIQNIPLEQKEQYNRIGDIDNLSQAEYTLIRDSQAENTTLNNDIKDDFADPDLVSLSTDLTSDNSAVNILNDLHNEDKNSGETTVANVSDSWLATQRDMLSFIAENTNALVDVEVKKQETSGPNSGKTRHTPTGKSTVLVKSSTKAALAGFMTRAENYVHEIYHAATHYAVRYLGSSNVHVRQLFKLFNLVKNNLTEEKIINALPNNIVNKEAVARVILQHMTAKNGDILTALEEFVAIGNSSEVIMTLLKNLKVKELVNDKVTAEGVFGKLVQSTKNLLKEFYSKLRFGIDKDMNAYEALQSLTKELAKINRQGIQQANKKKNKLAAFKEVIADKLDAKGKAMIEAITKKLNLTAYGLSTVYPGPDANVVQRLLFIGRAIPIAMIDPNFRELLSFVASHFPLFHDESFAQRILQDMFQNPKRKEVVTSLRLMADAIDSQRNIMNTGVKASLQEFFTSTTEDGKKYILSVDDNERTKLMHHMTVGISDTDMSALLDSGMSIKEIQKLVSDEVALNTAINQYAGYLKTDINTEFDKMWDSKGKRPINKEQYYRFLLNKADQLAYYMVTGDNRQPGLLVNAKAIADVVLDNNIRIKATKNLVKKLDTYITLLAISKLSSEVKASVSTVLDKFSKGSKDLLSYMRAINKEYKSIFPDRVYNRKKGYRPPVLDSSYSFKLGTKQEEEILNSQGYVSVGEKIDKDTYIYVNDTFGANATLNRTAMRYTTGEITTFNLKSVRNTQIVNDPLHIDTYTARYNASLQELQQDTMANLKKSFNTDTTAMNKRVSGDTSPASMIPLVSKGKSRDKEGRQYYYAHDYQYALTRAFKEVSLSANGNIFDVVADITSNAFDEIQTKNHNEKVIDAMVADWVANKDNKAFSRRFTEININSNNEYVRDMAKLIPTETMELLKQKFKEKGSDKVMVSSDMFVEFFGYKDMDVRNTKWYRTSKSPKMLKQLVAGSQLLMRKIARNAKTEIVVKNSKVIIGNASSNTMILLNYGVPLGEAFKSQFDAFLELEYYQKLQRDKASWEVKAKVATKSVEKDKAESRVKELQAQLKNSDVHELMESGLLPAIEDLENDSKDYFERYYEETYNKLPKAYKWLVDTMFITNKTELGKALYKLVHNSDFISRYALLKYLNRTKKSELIKEYMNKGKDKGITREAAEGMATRDIRAIVRDAFIDYGKLPSRGFKAVEDAGFIMFSKYATRIQKVIFNDLAKDRPFRTLALILGQSVSGINIEDPMDNTIFERDFTNLMSNPFSNVYNAYLTPAGFDALGRFME